MAVLKAEGVRASLTSRIADAEGSLAAMAPAVDTAQLKKLAAQREKFAIDMKAELDEVQELLRSVDRGDGKREAKIEALTERIALLNGKAECVVCGQPVTKELSHLLFETAVEEKKAVNATAVNAKRVSAGFEAQLAELRKDHALMQRDANDLNMQVASANSTRQQRAHSEALLDELRPKAEAAVRDELAARVRALETETVTGELDACVKVLGLRGVRAHVLGKSLGGLETVANGWLAKIAGSGITIALKPYTEKKTGGTSESISLEVTGAGGGEGYKGSSGGERRRIDVALLLALAEVAQAAHGASAGTIFFDECMDTLDGDGIDRISSVLNDLAKTRCVIVISHNPALSTRLQAVQRWDVAEGVVNVV
jgi:DNA repair exonuclease SbcCD ATPase subunit